MTTDSKLSGAAILWGSIIASFVAQFLPFAEPNEYLTRGYTIELQHLKFGQRVQTGWDLHPNYWMFYAALAAAWLIPAVRTNDNWRAFGPWVTAATLFYCLKNSAPFQTSGAGLATAAVFVAVWGAWRMRNARKSEELAAAEARKAAVSGEAS